MEEALTLPIIDNIGGNCPVQAEGTILGYAFYFRARGTHWSLSIANGPSKDPLEDDGWYYHEKYSDDDYAAGWMSEEEAIAFIHKAAEKFIAEVNSGQ